MGTLKSIVNPLRRNKYGLIYYKFEKLTAFIGLMMALSGVIWATIALVNNGDIFPPSTLALFGVFFMYKIMVDAFERRVLELMNKKDQ